MEKKTVNGIKNKNPMRIKKSGNERIGMADKQLDDEYITFRSLAYGYRAGWRDLYGCFVHLWVAGKGFNIRNIVNRMKHMADERAREAYIGQLTAAMGVTDREPLPAPNTREGYFKLRALMQAMVCLENGLEPSMVSVSAMDEGFRKAFPRQFKTRGKEKGKAKGDDGAQDGE